MWHTVEHIIYNHGGEWFSDKVVGASYSAEHCPFQMMPSALDVVLFIPGLVKVSYNNVIIKVINGFYIFNFVELAT